MADVAIIIIRLTNYRDKKRKHFQRLQIICQVKWFNGWPVIARLIDASQAARDIECMFESEQISKQKRNLLANNQSKYPANNPAKQGAQEESFKSGRALQQHLVADYIESEKLSNQCVADDFVEEENAQKCAQEANHNESESNGVSSQPRASLAAALWKSCCWKIEDFQSLTTNLLP